MTSKQDDTPEKRRLEQIREVIDVLATLYSEEQRMNVKHPISDVCTWLVEEFWERVGDRSQYEAEEGDPCPQCCPSGLGNRLAGCPNCDELVCERTLKCCEFCMVEEGADCPHCCESPVRGTQYCRAKFWKAIPFAPD